LKRIEENKQPEILVTEVKKKPILPLMPTNNFRVFLDYPPCDHDCFVNTINTL